MIKRTKLIRFPQEAIPIWKNRATNFSRIIKNETGKNVKIPVTDVFRFYSKVRPVIYHDQIINFFLNKKARKGENL